MDERIISNNPVLLGTLTDFMMCGEIHRYTSKMLLAAIDERNRGTYDFIYLPIDFKVPFFISHSEFPFSCFPTSKSSFVILLITLSDFFFHRINATLVMPSST